MPVLVMHAGRVSMFVFQPAVRASPIISRRGPATPPAAIAPASHGMSSPRRTYCRTARGWMAWTRWAQERHTITCTAVKQSGKYDGIDLANQPLNGLRAVHRCHQRLLRAQNLRMRATLTGRSGDACCRRPFRCRIKAGCHDVPGRCSNDQQQPFLGLQARGR